MVLSLCHCRGHPGGDLVTVRDMRHTLGGSNRCAILYNGEGVVRADPTAGTPGLLLPVPCRGRPWATARAPNRPLLGRWSANPVRCGPGARCVLSVWVQRPIRGGEGDV